MLLQNRPPHPTRRPARVYLLRIWLGERPQEYRFRLEDIRTGDGLLFRGLQEFADYIADDLGKEISETQAHLSDGQ